MLLLIDLLLAFGPVALEIERTKQVEKDGRVGAFHNADGFAPATVRIER